MSASAEVKGMSVAVTGGANGIGRAVAETSPVPGRGFASATSTATPRRRSPRHSDRDLFGLPLDVRDRQAFAGFLDTAEERHGPLDVMVNNAGIDWIGPFHEEPDDVSRREIDVNLFGTIIGSRLAVQRMLPRRRGHLVNVASGVGRVPLPGALSTQPRSTASLG